MNTRQVKYARAVALALVWVVVSAPARAALLNYSSTVQVTNDAGSVVAPTALAVIAQGRHAYVGAGLDNTLVHYAIDATGAWTRVASIAQGMDRPVQAVADPSQTRLYVLGNPDGDADTLTEFAIDAASGALSFSKIHINGQNGLAGLLEPSGLAVSPDGQHVYVAARGGDRVLVFARQNDSTLAYAGSVRNSTGNVTGLAGPGQVAVSPDGKHVYVTATLDHAVTAFARDAATGALSYVATLRDGVNGADGLSGAQALAVSPDGAHVYVGGLSESAIAQLRRDAVTGALTPQHVYRDGEVTGTGVISGLAQIIALRVTPDANKVYAVSIAGNALVRFDRHPLTGALTFGGAQVDGSGGIDGLQGPLDLIIDARGEFLYTLSTENRIGRFRADTLDLALALNAAPADSVEPSTPVVFTATVTNHGPLVASGVVATLRVAGATASVAVNPSQGSCSSSAEGWWCALGALAQNTTATLTVTTTRVAAGGIELVAGVYADQNDTPVANGHASARVAVNTVPTARADDVVVNFGASGTRIDVLANDSDADGDAIRVTGVSAATKGSVELVAGEIRYTAPVGGATQDAFTYTIADDYGATAQASVTVRFNTAPLAYGDSATTGVNTPVTIFVLANDSDPDPGDALTLSAYDAATAQRGVVSALHLAAATMAPVALMYTPPANFTGTDTFAYEVSDGRGGVATAMVSVTVGDNVAPASPPPEPIAPATAAKKRGGGAIDALGLLLLVVSLILLTRRTQRR